MVSKTSLIVAGLLVVGAGLATATYVTADAGTPATEKPACAYSKARDKVDSYLEKHGDKKKAQEKAEKRLLKIDEKCQRHAAKRAAPFEKDGEAVEGKWTSFAETEGGLASYRSVGPWADALIFDSVTVEGLTGNGTTKGPVYSVKGDGVGLVAFNAPNAGLFVVARDGATVTYDVADGIETAQIDTSTVELSRDGHTARIHARDGTLAVDGDTITATLEGKGAVGFAIAGYPRMLEMEKRAIRHILEREDASTAAVAAEVAA